MLVRYGAPLALAARELEAGITIVDLDDPSTLTATDLRPSQVAGREDLLEDGDGFAAAASRSVVMVVRVAPHRPP